MSTRDPALTRPSRVVLAATLYAIAVVAAGVGGWGWAGVGNGPQMADSHVVALMAGQFGGVGAFIGTAFALPMKYRNSANPATWLVIGLMMAGLPLAAGVGFAISGMIRAALLLAAFAAVIAGLVVWRWRARLAREDRGEEVRRTGKTVVGVVTESTTNSTVNDVPRWRIVVKFVDSAGTTRWFTTHKTTYSAPSVGLPVAVHFDPARPGDKRRIFVDF